MAARRPPRWVSWFVLVFWVWLGFAGILSAVLGDRLLDISLGLLVAVVAPIGVWERWQFLRGRSARGPQISMMLALLGQATTQVTLADDTFRWWLLGGMFVLVVFSLFSEIRRQKGRPIAFDRWIDARFTPRQLTYATFGITGVGVIVIGIWAYLAYGAAMLSVPVFGLTVVGIAFWVALRQLARQGD
ncbi:hypothetical protein JL108_02605 [Aeromicrobium sp. YIM 150415]|uniref:hypothetical protein n=1 Tax=Aeromicrobium sp. YIM 150415 TaxID=2803912 RepID=UPI001966B91A|nr:hypothetical protein [Aeromicrobium sp. YIM 150415]MBM9462322.1 hypothetical protein [Aeromicrobium sp. YIM 150415]